MKKKIKSNYIKPKVIIHGDLKRITKKNEGEQDPLGNLS